MWQVSIWLKKTEGHINVMYPLYGVDLEFA